MTDTDRLISLLQTSAPCIYISTDDEEHALRLVRDAAMTLNRSIREWALSKGFDIAPRGRIKQEIVDEYHRTGGR